MILLQVSRRPVEAGEEVEMEPIGASSQSNVSQSNGGDQSGEEEEGEEDE